MSILLHPSGAETVTGQSVANNLEENEVIALFVNVTAASGGTPTLDVKVQDSPDGITWYDVPSLATAQFVTTGSEAVRITVGTKLAEKVRLDWTISGTGPSFTFTADLSTVDLNLNS